MTLRPEAAEVRKKGAEGMNAQYVTSSEVARYLNISRSSVNTLARQGKIPGGIRVGHSRRWNMPKLIAWCEAQEGAINSEV